MLFLGNLLVLVSLEGYVHSVDIANNKYFVSYIFCMAEHFDSPLNDSKMAKIEHCVP